MPWGNTCVKSLPIVKVTILIAQSNKGFALRFFNVYIHVFFTTELKNHICFDVTWVIYYLCLISYFLDKSANLLYLFSMLNQSIQILGIIA